MNSYFYQYDLKVDELTKEMNEAENKNINHELFQAIRPHIEKLITNNTLQMKIKAILSSVDYSESFTNVSHTIVSGISEANQHKYASWKGKGGTYSKATYGDYSPPRLTFTYIIPEFSIEVEYDVKDQIMRAADWKKITQPRLYSLKANIGKEFPLTLIIRDFNSAQFALFPSL